MAVSLLRAPRSAMGDLKMATGDVQRDRSEAIKAMTEGLITIFGDRAILVARRQLEMAVGPDSIATWQTLVDMVTASNDGVPDL